MEQPDIYPGTSVSLRAITWNLLLEFLHICPEETEDGHKLCWLQPWQQAKPANRLPYS